LNADGSQILQCLEQVAAERACREADETLSASVQQVKAFQHHRFSATYADLMRDPRYGEATLFFLEDLYGPGDFSQRDTQFARIVPALIRLFAAPIVHTVAELAQLHALSEQLDTQMARSLDGRVLDAAVYGELWRAVGRHEARERQIALIVSVGQALDRYTRKPMLRHSLRVMRVPARAAGLGALQTFLERGFDTFRAMRGAEEFLLIVSKREQAFAALLFGS
jgi:hypothetical protein